MGSNNETFHFGCGIDFSSCDIAMVACSRIIVVPFVRGLILAASRVQGMLMRQMPGSAEHMGEMQY